ncbi:MAG: lyase, partial [Rubrivivax sp.]
MSIFVTRRHALGWLGAGALAAHSSTSPAQTARQQSWPLKTPSRTGIHDLAPASDGGVWFTAQRSGHLGWFDQKSGRVELIALGAGSAPHGVIAGPDRAAWITDG